MGIAENLPWSKEEFERQLRAKGKAYHIYHPFNVMMSAGKCTPEQLRGWVANRFYYQISIPLKDAAILSNMPIRDFRREWITRITDHDGYEGEPGGIEAWTRLGEAVGVKRDELWSLKHVLPGVRFAVDAYVNFARQRPWQEAVCSSLTELFAPEIHKNRLATWPEHYKWVEPEGLAYFRNRIVQARKDVEQALAITLDYFNTRELQERALQILQFKLDVLWVISDTIQLYYARDTVSSTDGRMPTQ